ncbi:MAG: SRPBCC domain-containing protein [Ferruginibacter sp.]
MEIFQIEKTYNAPIALLWQAITDREMMKEWYFNFGEDFKLETGAVFEWTAGDTEDNQWLHQGKMLEIIKDEKLVHTWAYPGYSGISTVSWNLSKVNDSTTKVTLIHEFTVPFDSTVAALKTENFEMGWNHIINISLQEYLDKIQK